jgi:hypothetical protein
MCAYMHYASAQLCCTSTLYLMVGSLASIFVLLLLLLLLLL